MLTRRTVLGLLAAGLSTFATRGSAAETVPFDREAFDAAGKAGQPVLIDISASWCPTCQRQKKILSELLTLPRFAEVTIFEVDYDTEKGIMRSFGAQQRSTLIVFKGDNEVGRSVADTRPASIEALLSKAI